MRKPLLLALLLLSATACTSVAARPLVQMDVIDRDSGQWLPEYRHRGDTWVPGTPGHRYAVRLSNQSGERVLVVLSVDGVNAVTGETADPSQAGYVLAPWQSTEIGGWRKSLDDVAQFVFTDLPDSYAARTGRPDNVGVIGIAVFDEARPIVDDQPAAIAREGMRGAERRSAMSPSSANAADAAEGAVAAQRIGTGHGAREWAPVGRTGFVRASLRPAQVVQLRYDDGANLVAMGIIHATGPAPEAFPSGFVADPPGW
ncbi:hypothetical protein [Cognatiluteimonas profundi]|uniref:hypothetical protein n=1 Tax=Cognatiluteimonas profundi TaxID=2594501 RepID=UPI00131BE233|nr:hypothetical protein [Lysobacter profundi]